MLLLISPVLFVLSNPLIKAEWVEIPQITKDKTETTFFLGSPKSPMSTTLSPVTDNVLRKPTFFQTTTPAPNRKKNGMDKKSKGITSTTPAYGNSTEFMKKHAQLQDDNGFLPFLNTIQSTLTDNAKKGLKSKVEVLRHLRDNLLINIDEKMTSLWSRNDKTSARGHQDDDDDHHHEMDFPSNEGALMTIGFLTFAVFLIKTVLKLIQVIKNKANKGTMNGTMMMMTTQAPDSYIGRKKRELEDNNLRILQLIDEFQFNKI